MAASYGLARSWLLEKVRGCLILGRQSFRAQQFVVGLAPFLGAVYALMG